MKSSPPGARVAARDRVAPRLICLLAVSAVAWGRSSSAQTDTLSVDDGGQPRVVARLLEGRWVAEKWCTSGEPRSGASDRVSVSGALRLTPVRAVAPASAEWQRLMPTIIELFEQRERQERVSDKTSNGPRAVDWIYAVEEGDRRTYYFEASRRVSSATQDVDQDTDPSGTLRIAVAGFLRESRDGFTSLGTKSELRWEQDGLPAGPARADLTPLGVIGQGDRAVWVMKGQSGTSVWYALYEVGGQTRTLLTLRPGRC